MDTTDLGRAHPRRKFDWSRKSVGDMLQSVDPSHDKYLRQAFINVAAFLFVGGVAAFLFGVYFIMGIFLKPLMWSLMVGAFLYPFKKKSSDMARLWIRGCIDAGVPSLLMLAALPILIVDRCLEHARCSLAVVWKFLLPIILVAVFFILASDATINYLIRIFGLFLERSLTLWHYACSHASVIMVATLLLANYSSTFLPSGRIPRFLGKVFLGAAFVSMLLLLAGVCSPFMIPVVGTVVLMVFLGVIDSVQEWVRDKHPVSGYMSRLPRLLRQPDPGSASTPTPSTDISSSLNSGDAGTGLSKDLETQEEMGVLNEQSPWSGLLDTISKVQGILVSSLEAETTGFQWPTPSTLFSLLAWMACLMFVWRQPVLLAVVPTLLFLFAIRWLLRQVVPLYLPVAAKFCGQRFGWTAIPVAGLFPKTLLGLFMRGDRKALGWILENIDSIVSAFVIVFVMIGGVMASVFLVVKTHEESIVFARIITAAITEAVPYHSYQNESRELIERLSFAGSSFEQTVDDVYHTARDHIQHQLQNVFGNATNSSIITVKNLLTLIDRIYFTIFNKTDVLAKDSVRHGSFSWKNIRSTLNISELVAVLKDNISTLKSLVESVWLVLATNVVLLFHVVLEVLNLVVVGGNYLVNLLLSVLVFLTALFYLLSFSTTRYIPVVWMSGITITTDMGQLISQSVYEVFGASIKMATFYGVYFWITHTMFESSLVFIPSVLGAMLAAVPFVSSFWAALPAVLDLWLLQTRGWAALVLLSAHLVPTYLVDTLIYGNIHRGGHPYLTALSVAGGVYCLGMEGTIIGPTVLCCLIMATQMYKQMLV